jgi:uncharacterized protein YkwD
MVLRALAVLGIALAVTGCTSPEPMPTSATDYAQQLFEDTNPARQAGGELPPLTWNDCLADKATPRAQEASTQDILEHEPITPTCTQGNEAGENLSKGNFTPQEIVDKWMNSAGHQANVLNPNFVDAGVGCVPLPDEKPGYACSLLFEGDTGVD